jgi:hypothetical protein
LTLEAANAEISELRGLVQTGDYPHEVYANHAYRLEELLALKDARKLKDLEDSIPHPLPSHTDKGDVDFVQRPEYQTMEMQEASLLAMDARQGDQFSLAQPLPPAPIKFGEMSAKELDREVEIRNPHSVHNWLKRHGEKDAGAAAGDDAASEVGVSTPATGRKRAGNLAKRVGDKAVDRARGGDKNRDEGSPASVRTTGTTGETEAGEDEVMGDDTLLTASARKKGGDKDDTYRPKGGRSKAKRKRGEDGETTPSAAKGKKAKTSAAAAAAAAVAAAAATATDS